MESFQSSKGFRLSGERSIDDTLATDTWLIMALSFRRNNLSR